MSLSDVASVLSIAEFAGRIISHFKKKKKKAKTRTAKPRLPKQTKEEKLVEYILTHKAEDSLKKISVEYLVKNRTRILRKIEKKVLDES